MFDLQVCFTDSLGIQGTILIFSEMSRMVFQILLNVIFAWYFSFCIICFVLLITSVVVCNFKLCFWSTFLRECVIVKIKLIIFIQTINSVDVKRRRKQSDFEKEVTSSYILMHSKACSICNKLSLKNIKDSCRSTHLVSYKLLN